MLSTGSSAPRRVAGTTRIPAQRGTVSPETPTQALVARLVLLAFVIGGTGVLLGSLVLPTAMAVTGVVDAVSHDVLDVPPLPENFEVAPERSVIHAADGSRLAEIFFRENRVSVDLSQVPAVTRDAIIATEDADFYNHPGINHAAILRAALTNLRAGEIEQGGSTITQQLIKNAADLSREKTLDRKIKEAVWAVEVERRWTKDQILERYLNRTYFGRGVYGIGTAAGFYFGKKAGQLGLADSALLAGLIRAPERNDPLADPDRARTRRNVVLDQMADQGFITRAQAETAARQPLGLDVHETSQPEQPFFVAWVTRLLIDQGAAEGLGTQVDALQALGDTPKERIRAVFQGGLRIHTTLHPDMQAQANAAVGEILSDPLHDPMGALVSVRPGSGAISALAVGPKKHGECEEPVEVTEEGRELCDKTSFNPVVPADAGSSRVGRQPGSAFKPFLVTAALEAGFPPGWEIEATGPQTIPPDQCPNPGQGAWTVNNAGGNGLRNMYSGVKASSNVFHARLIAEVGAAKVAEVARRLGIRRSPLPEVCSLALGAVEVFPLEMASAFGTLANLGVYCEPFAISRIEDRHGNLLYKRTPRCERVLDRDIARRVVDIMEGPVTPGGTAPHANLGRWPTRGKTGTTQDYRDAWFVGYVKQLATAAWIGFEENPAQNPLRNVTINGQHYSRVFGSTLPAPMWKAYMQEAVQLFEPEGWPGPEPMPTTVVPDLTDLQALEEIKEALEEARLNLVTETIEDWRPPETPLVDRQRPAPDTEVPAGSAVVVPVSDGQGEVPRVPDVVGLTEREARKKLTGIGYEVVVETQVTDNPEEEGVVLEQDPRAGREYPPGEGAEVTIEVGDYEPRRNQPGQGPPWSRTSPSPGTSPGSSSPSPPSPSPSLTPSPTPSPTDEDQG